MKDAVITLAETRGLASAASKTLYAIEAKVAAMNDPALAVLVEAHHIVLSRVRAALAKHHGVSPTAIAPNPDGGVKPP